MTPESRQPNLDHSLRQGATNLARLSFFFPAALGIQRQLNDHDSSNGPHVSIGLSKILAAGLFGGMLYDLTGSQFGRRTAQVHTARILATTWVIDYLIDDFGMEPARKIEVLRSLQSTLESAQPKTYRDSPQLDRASVQVARLGRALQMLPHPEPVRDAAQRLMEAAVRQIEADPTIEISEELGAATGRALAIVPYGWNNNLSPRYLRAFEAFFGYLQLFDDLHDAPHDRRHGLRTFVTTAPTLTFAEREALPRAKNLMVTALSALQPEERWAIQFLFKLSSHAWAPLRAYAPLAPRPEEFQLYGS